MCDTYNILDSLTSDFKEGMGVDTVSSASSTASSVSTKRTGKRARELDMDAIKVENMFATLGDSLKPSTADEARCRAAEAEHRESIATQLHQRENELQKQVMMLWREANKEEDEELKQWLLNERDIAKQKLGELRL
jgi:hypothetical protein